MTVQPITGKCRFCKSKVWLKDGKWLHDGIGVLVHAIKNRNEGSQ